MIFQNNPFASLQGGGFPNMAGAGGFAGPMQQPSLPSFGGMGGGMPHGLGPALGAFASAFGQNMAQQGGGHGGMFSNPLAMMSPLAAMFAHKPKLGFAAVSPLLGGLNAAGLFD